MKSFRESMEEYHTQIEKGDIQEAYRGLMEYIAKLRSYLHKKYPEYVISGSIYPGYMDMTYFAFFPESLQRLKLKVAIVFIHDAFRFEVWLAGVNKEVQNHYWRLFRERGWTTYLIPASIKGRDSILEYTVVQNPDFGDLDALTEQIERETVAFIGDVETFVSRLDG